VAFPQYLIGLLVVEHELEIGEHVPQPGPVPPHHIAVPVVLRKLRLRQRTRPPINVRPLRHRKRSLRGPYTSSYQSQPDLLDTSCARPNTKRRGFQARSYGCCQTGGYPSWPRSLNQVSVPRATTAQKSPDDPSEQRSKATALDGLYRAASEAVGEWARGVVAPDVVRPRMSFSSGWS
jgi:hypothetical protein